MFRPHWVCPAQGCLCFPVYTAQAPGWSIWSGPCVECGSSFRVLHKSADLVAPAFCVFSGLSGSGSQRFGRPLPGCGAPFPSAASGPGSQRLGHPLPGCGAPFPSAVSGSGSQRLGPIEYFLKVTSIPAYAHLSTLHYYFKYQYNSELSACILLISEKNVSSDTRQSCFQSLLVITTSYNQYKY